VNKIALVVTIRTGSSRLPNKMTLPIADGKCSIDFFKALFDRLKEQYGDFIRPVIAIPECEGEDFVNEFARRGMVVFKGSENDVLSRVVNAAKAQQCDYIMDVTGDCPFVSNALIDQIVIKMLPNVIRSEEFYCSNVFPKRTNPDGQDIQLYSTATLARIYENHDYLPQHSGWNVFDKYKDNSVFKIINAFTPIKGKYRGEDQIRMTLDTEEDVITLAKMHPLFNLFSNLTSMSEYRNFVSCLCELAGEWFPNYKVKAKGIGE
jgi:spore coat polysaccharide biosynthesis protein SpsF